MYKHMEEKNVEMDRVTYITLIDTLMRNGKVELASEVRRGNRERQRKGKEEMKEEIEGY